jgi:hypothetical protein
MLDRIVSLLVLVAAAIVPVDVISFFQLREIQFVAAVLIVVITVLYDYLSGLILGLTLIVIYYRLHHKYLTYVRNDTSVRLGGPMVSLVREYITPQHLEDAQNNIINDVDARQEMVGIRGVYGEDVYGAQGMFKTLPGMVKEAGAPLDVEK